MSTATCPTRRLPNHVPPPDHQRRRPGPLGDLHPPEGQAAPLMTVSRSEGLSARRPPRGHHPASSHLRRCWTRCRWGQPASRWRTWRSGPSCRPDLRAPGNSLGSSDRRFESWDGSTECCVRPSLSSWARGGNGPVGWIRLITTNARAGDVMRAIPTILDEGAMSQSAGQPQRSSSSGI